MNARFNTGIISRLAAEIRDAIGDDDPDLIECIDAETDVLDITDRLLGELGEAEAWEEAAKHMAERYALRAKRMAEKQRSLKKALGSILDATGEKSLRRPLATVSRTRPHTSVVITDEASVPTQLCRITKSPDKAAIKAQIEAGESVPGAELQQGAPGVAVRR